MPAERKTAKKTLHIVIADDHEVVRRGIQALLESYRGWEVIGEAENAQQAIEKAGQLQPDLIVVDLSLPGGDGLSMVHHLRASGGGREVLVLTYHGAPAMVRAVFNAGARGYVLKSDAGTDLIAAVETLSRHEYFVSPRIAQTLPEGYDLSGGPSVTGN